MPNPLDDTPWFTACIALQSTTVNDNADSKMLGLYIQLRIFILSEWFKIISHSSVSKIEIQQSRILNIY